MSGRFETSDDIQKLRAALDNADAVIIGAGAGLSTSAGFLYTGERFQKYFGDFAAKYHFTDMYTGGFYQYPAPEENWAYWSRYIYINRYMMPPKPVEAAAGRNAVARATVARMPARVRFALFFFVVVAFIIISPFQIKKFFFLCGSFPAARFAVFLFQGVVALAVILVYHTVRHRSVTKQNKRTCAHFANFAGRLNLKIKKK